MARRQSRVGTPAFGASVVGVVAPGAGVGVGVAQLTIADSIIDQPGGVAIGGVFAQNVFSPPIDLSPPLFFSPPFFSPPLLSPPAAPGAADLAAQTVQLERVTVLGRIRCDVLHGSECLLDDIAVVDDQQAGCIRFSRYERGSVLPRRFQCVPSNAQLDVCDPLLRCLPPVFNSRRFGRPDYAQLAAACPPAMLTASEVGAEVGAFADLLNTIRLENLDRKLHEFLPVGLAPIIIAET